MSDDVVRLSLVGQVLRRRWPLVVCYAIVGVLAGTGASALFSPGYETSVSVVVQGERTKDELVTEAVIATNAVVLDRTADALGWGIEGVDLRDSVQAEVVAGNVIEIAATAQTPARAQRLVDQVAKEYVAYSKQLVSDPAAASSQVVDDRQKALRGRIEEAHRRINQLHQASSRDELTVDGVQLRTELESLRTALTKATEDLAEAQAASSVANLVVMGRAARPYGPAAPSLLHFTVGGGVLFAVLGLFGHLLALSADRRLESGPAMVAALGVPMVGGVAVTAKRPRRKLFGRRRPPDGAGLDSPELRSYQRILGRLRQQDDGELRLLVVAARDDRLSHHAVAGIARAAGTDSGHLTTLWVAHVSASSPEVPEHDDVSAVLIVAGVGTRRPWELAGMADACSVAGYEIAGAVIARRARGRASAPTEAELVVGSQRSSEDGTTLAATR